MALFSGCNREFEWEGFGVNNDDTEEHCIKLEKDSEGSTRISVYSDSEWSAELENKVDWATVAMDTSSSTIKPTAMPFVVPLCLSTARARPSVL